MRVDFLAGRARPPAGRRDERRSLDVTGRIA